MNPDAQLSATPPPSTIATGSLWGRCTLILLGLLAAILIAHQGVLFSGFGRMQQVPGDTLFNNYLFEHSYQFLRGSPLHQSLWDLPIFYPARHTLFYSDLMISFAPPYWMLRAAGLPPDLSFQLWMMLATAANFSICMVFLVRCFRFGIPASVFGSIFFAAANSRIFDIGHQQLYCQVYVVGALIAAYMLFERPAALSPRAAARRARLCIVMMFLCLALQFWGGFYFGFFMLLGGLIALLWALLLPQLRRPLLATLRRHYVTFIASALGAGVILAPAASGYLALYSSFKNSFHSIVAMNPNFYTWMSLGPFNIWHRWMWDHWVSLRTMPVFWEHVMGLGIFTTPVVLIAAWHGRKQPRYYLLSLIVITLIVLATAWHGLSLWWIVYRIVPGAKAIRAVARIGLVLLIPAAVALAYALNWLSGRGMHWLTLLLGIACVGEQAQYDASFSRLELRQRIQTIAQVVPSTAEVFYVTTPQDRRGPYYQIEAMWAAQEVGKRTINGYSGNNPPGYGLERTDRINTPETEEFVRRKLLHWIQTQNIDPNKVAWINGDQPMTLVDASWRDGFFVPDTNAIAAFAASPEFYQSAGNNLAAWITTIYRVFLDRDPEPGGVQFWINVMHNEIGKRRVDLAHDLIGSTEMRAKGVEPNVFQCCGSRGLMVLNNPGDSVENVVVSMTIYTASSEDANLSITGDLLTKHFVVNGAGTLVSMEIAIPPGEHPMTFSCDAALSQDANDAQDWAFRMYDFRVTQAGSDWHKVR